MKRVLLVLMLLAVLGPHSILHAQTARQVITLQNAATATGDGVNLGVAGWPTVGVQVVIADTATITFEGRVDETGSWVAAVCSDSATGTLSSTASASGLYQCNVAGFSQFRARISSHGAGAVTVKALVTLAAGKGGGGGGGLPGGAQDGDCLQWNTDQPSWAECPGAGSGAPTDATYITQTPQAGLSAEQALSALATGILKSTNGTGVLSIAAAGTDYVAPAGNVATATALAADPTDCNAGEGTRGINASGTAQNCTNFAEEQGSNGLTAKTAANTYTNRTITGTASEISVANGSGASGNPTISLPSSIALAGKTVTVGNGGSIAASGTGTVTATGVAANSVALTTDTTGDYVDGVIADKGLQKTGTEGADLGLIDCADGEVLKSNATNQWGCSTDDLGGAPTDAQYWVGAADGTLSAEKNLGVLGTGLVINTAGVPSILTTQTCTNQVVRVLSASGTVTCATITSAFVDSSVLTTGGAGTVWASVTDSNTWSDGVKQTFNPNGTNAGINVGSHTADAGSPADGDILYNSTSTTFRFRENGEWKTLGVQSLSDTLDTVSDRGKEIDGANSSANCVKIGAGSNNGWCIYHDGSDGPQIRQQTAANTKTIIETNFTWALRDIEGAADVVTVDPDAASKNAMYQFGTNYKPVASFYVPLSPRGAVTITETNVVTNQPKGWWAQVTDANTDAVDFHFPITKKMEGATTATVRLWGVSDHATPSGNIVLHCAMKAYRPGTDTYEAHQTTGEQSVTLTPATQNRPVSAVSSAVTINGTVAEFGEMIGSCEVDATGTTSAQLTDFFLRGDALIQLLVNSWSD